MVKVKKTGPFSTPLSSLHVERVSEGTARSSSRYSDASLPPFDFREVQMYSQASPFIISGIKKGLFLFGVLLFMAAFTFTEKQAISMPAARVENVIITIVKVGKGVAIDVGEIELLVIVGETV